MHTCSRGQVMLGSTPDVIDDVIIVEFPGGSKATVVNDGSGFPRRDDVTATACDNDSEADDENEAGGNSER